MWKNVVYYSCERTIVHADPEFVSQLPTVVTQTFPCVNIASGPVMHEWIFYKFVKLATNKMLFGICSGLSNEQHVINVLVACCCAMIILTAVSNIFPSPMCH